ncbi:unnamed protein product, partial [Owenia fusiformis]
KYDLESNDNHFIEPFIFTIIFITIHVYPEIRNFNLSGKEMDIRKTRSNVILNLGICILIGFFGPVNAQGLRCPEDYACYPLGGYCNEDAGICDCYHNFRGVRCSDYTDPCMISLACGGQVSGTCIPQRIGLRGYKCICREGYIGVECERDVRWCTLNRCENGGLCQSFGAHGVCHCPPGFTGIRCEQDRRCTPIPCRNGGMCIPGGINGEIYTCDCPSLYTGRDCEIKKQACLPSPCGMNGLCLDRGDSYVCDCFPGYTGVQCEQEIDFCVNVTCSYHGSCYNNTDRFSCFCNPGYTGYECEIDVDPCISSPCQHGGACRRVATPFNYTCSCTHGYTGRHCETDDLFTKSVWGVTIGTGVLLVVFFIFISIWFGIIIVRLKKVAQPQRLTRYVYGTRDSVGPGMVHDKEKFTMAYDNATYNNTENFPVGNVGPYHNGREGNVMISPNLELHSQPSETLLRELNNRIMLYEHSRVNNGLRQNNSR